MIRRNLSFGLLTIISTLLLSCGDKTRQPTTLEAGLSLPDEKTTPASRSITEAFKSYWYAGEAEITSYELEQARYGELRQGHAVLIYVTEPFLPEIQVKADRQSRETPSVLKLNSTKKYLTGIYPYSIMTSTFSPVRTQEHAIKVSGSVQEWCGHTYTQINNRKQFEYMSHSYFEGEADETKTLEPAYLENEIWTLIRLAPEELPIGQTAMIPSLEYIRTAHIDAKAYQAEASLEEDSDLSAYTIHYPELGRTLAISFETAFPHTIAGWTETARSGYGAGARELTSKASLKKRIKGPYWRQNSNSDSNLRDSLGL